MPDNSLQDAVASALTMSDSTEIVETIKSAVIHELEQLDPGARITKTDYFNHSFAPDLVLSWPDKSERSVYLRYNLLSTRAARDLELLGGDKPVIFSLDSSHDDATVAEAIEPETQQAAGTLVTNAPAIDGFTDFGLVHADDSQVSVSDPLINLFRRNVVRGGRGLLVSDTADRIQARPDSGNFEAEIEYINDFESTVSGMFQEDAAFRLQRAASLVRVARTGEFDEDPQQVLASELRGTLSADELRVLLPYLLSRATAVNDQRFWNYLGSMISLENVEELAEHLGSFDLGDLVRANLYTWRAVRSMMSFDADSLDRSADEAPTAPSWSIDARMLCARAGRWKVHFTTNRRRGGGRDDSLLARWDELLPHLQGYAVSAVDLQGITRRVQVSGDSGARVADDVSAIHSSIEDDFKVRSLEIVPQDDESSAITADFRTLLADGSNVPIGDLAGVSFDLLGHRYPLTVDERDALIG
jgi:hypothetical protein